MTSIRTKESGVIKNIKKTLVKVNGKWLTVTSVKIKTNGKWL